MEFNIFIAPITMIAVEMAKRAGLESKYLAFVAVVFGALFGAFTALFTRVTSLLMCLKDCCMGHLHQACGM